MAGGYTTYGYISRNRSQRPFYKLDSPVWSSKHYNNRPRTQFESELFRELGKLIGFKRNRTTTYHPQSNGFLERWHRTLKTAIMCKNNLQWSKVLPIVLLGLRTTLREEFKVTPAEMVYGGTLRLPSSFLQPPVNTNQSIPELVANLKDSFNQIRPVHASNHAKENPFIFKDLKNCSYVFVRKDHIKPALQPPYEGPYPVISKENNFFTVLNKNRNVKIALDRLKPYFVENTEYPLTEPKPVNEVKEKMRVTFADELLPTCKTSRVERQIIKPSRFR